MSSAQIRASSYATAVAKRLVPLIGILGMLVNPAGAQSPLRLWNTLGSDWEVTHSEVGPNGWVVGSGQAYEPARFDTGFINKQPTGWAVAKFPGSILHALNERGTIELWIVPKVPNPVPFQYGIWALIGAGASEAWHTSRGNIYLIWGDGVTGRGFFGGVQFDGQHARTPDEATQFVATSGVPIHAAICWDIDGIDGTSDRVRVYRDGLVVGATSSAWNPAGTVLQDRFETGSAADSQGYDKYISDNIKVWDYAKTDFTDRFCEAGPARLELLAEDLDCRNIANNQLAVEVRASQDFTGIIAGQFFVQFDPETLQLEADDIVAVWPWTELLLAEVDNVAGTADVAVSIPAGGGGGGGAMARLTFSIVGDTCEPQAGLVAFRTHTPPTRLTDMHVNDYSVASGCLAVSDLEEITTDVHAPAIAAPGDLDLECGPANSTAITAWLASATATDDCEVDSLTNDYAGLAGGCAGAGSALVTWTATDPCGNVTTIQRTVTVTDTTPPDFPDAEAGVLPPIESVADAGLCTATLTILSPTVLDDCDASPALAGVRDDLESLDAAYPAGVTTITWTAGDCAENETSVTQQVVVAPVNAIDVSLEFSGSWSSAPYLRCIRFELFPADCSTPLVIEREVVFTGPIAEPIVLEVPCGEYGCMTARDPVHSLRSTDLDVTIADRRYVSSFLGDDALRLGNLYQRGEEYRYVDILDLAVLLSRFGLSAPQDTACGFLGRHADLTGDGTVGLGDLSLLLTNFGRSQEPNCCGASGVASGGRAEVAWSLVGPVAPQTSIRVDELRARGFEELAAADLNQDGSVDLRDAAAAVAGARAVPVRAIGRVRD